MLLIKTKSIKIEVLRCLIFQDSALGPVPMVGFFEESAEGGKFLFGQKSFGGARSPAERSKRLSLPY